MTNARADASSRSRVVIPVHNAADGSTRVAAWLDALGKLGRGYELLVVDDGSTDGTADEVPSELAARRPHLRRAAARDAPRVRGLPADRPRRGDAPALLLHRPRLPLHAVRPRQAARPDRASATRCIGRQPTSSAAAGPGGRRRRSGERSGRGYRLFCRVALGHRRASRCPAWLGFRRALRGRGSSWLMFGVPLADVNSAFKLFRTAFLDRFPIQSDGDFVHAELVAKATFLTCIMDEVPLTPKPDPIPPRSVAPTCGEGSLPQRRSSHPPARPAGRPPSRRRRRPQPSHRSAMSHDRPPADPVRHRQAGRAGPAAASSPTSPRGRVRRRRRRPADHRRRPDDRRLGRPPPHRPAGRRPRHPARACAAATSARWPTAAGVPVERGPKDLRDLPEYFGTAVRPAAGLRRATTSTSSPRSTTPRSCRSTRSCAEARRYRAERGRRDRPRLRPRRRRGPASATRCGRCATTGFRVSIDSFDPDEVEAAVAAGAELVLSVNGTNVEHAALARAGAVEVVAIPDTPADLDGLDAHRRAARRLAACRSASTRSWSRSASASPRRWAATSKCAAATPTPR